MNGRLKHFLAILLAVSTMAAQAVCVCPAVGSEARPAQQAEEACRGSGKCCVQGEPTVPVPAPSEQNTPCENCNVIHPADRIQPERQDAPVTVYQPFLALTPVPPIYASVSALPLAAPSGAERVPIPPLLQDLFHSGTLLLI
jgi:hypothetical protein